jgi:hypothetical protein
MPARKIQRLRFDQWRSVSEDEGESFIDLHCSSLDGRRFDSHFIKLDRSRIPNFGRHLSATECMYCSEKLSVPFNTGMGGGLFKTSRRYRACIACGFWTHVDVNDLIPNIYTIPALKEFDHTSLTPSLSHLSKELFKNPAKMCSMEPYLFERFVGSILSDFSNVRYDGLERVVMTASTCSRSSRINQLWSKLRGAAFQQDFASSFGRRARRCMVVTTAKQFSRAAQKWATSEALKDANFHTQLIDFHSLASMVEAVAQHTTRVSGVSMQRRRMPSDGREPYRASIYDKTPDFTRVLADRRTRADEKERGRKGQWCPGAESNHRHCDFQSHALPTELPGHFA